MLEESGHIGMLLRDQLVEAGIQVGAQRRSTQQQGDEQGNDADGLAPLQQRARHGVDQRVQ